ncbi:MAG: prolipoprotein diacylglyceryl transferase [Clostridia bacterium]|nr:prolipoprotein diacylglyceryl transferase [Clostridia bacterium]
MCTEDLFGVISWYSIWIVVGVAACLFLYDWLCKKRKITLKANKFYYILGIVSIIVGFFFATLVQSIYNYIESVRAGDPQWDWGGITFMGGMFGGVVAFVIGALIFAKGEVRAQFPAIAEIGAACIPTAHAFGRIGCFCAGCCYGNEVHEHDAFSFLGVTFKQGAGRGVLRYPTQLFEAAFLFILAIALIICVLRDKRFNAILYFGGYGVFRFLLEFIRGDDRGSIGSSVLAPSQVLSIVCMVIALLCVAYKIVKRYSPKTALAVLRFFRLDDESTGGVPVSEQAAPETAEAETKENIVPEDGTQNEVDNGDAAENGAGE